MGILKQMVACLATCGFKSKCNMRMCSCFVSDCMISEHPYNNESNSVSSVQSKKLKRESNKQLVNRLRTAIV